MIGIGIFVGTLGFGLLTWLLFDLYVYMLPIWVGALAGIAAYHTGAGLLGAFIVGGVIAMLTFAAGRAALKSVRSPAIRIAIMLLFVVPAAFAGYSVTLEFVRWLEVPSVVWQQVYALFGAFVVGGTALARLTDPDPPDSEETI